jgi:hypothetical protein
MTKTPLLLTLGATLTLIACGPKKDLPTLAVDDAPAEQILKAAQERTLPAGVAGQFSFAAELPARVIPGVLTGRLVVQQPGHLRLDVLPPVGGQVLIAASNGEHLHVLLPLEYEWWGASDVETVLRDATAAAVGIEDFTELLVGQLPALDGMEPEVLDEGEVGPIVRYTGPEGVQVDVELDRAGYMWRSIEARDGEGTLLLSTVSEGIIHTDDAWYPSKMAITLPTLDIVLKLRYRSWQTLPEPGDVFHVPVPVGYTEIDMMARLDQAVAEHNAAEAVPETAVPETAVPETAVPETAVPETAVPETAVPETAEPVPGHTPAED